MELHIEPQRTAGQQAIDQKITDIQNQVLPNLDTAATITDILRELCRWMDHYDDTLSRHGWRTAHYAGALGRASGFREADLTLLEYAGLLHDIGKLTIPASILGKVGPLTDDEYALIECHPRAGAQLIMQFPPLQVPAIWIAHHHERWDGFGYPYGLKGYFTPLGARILAVADTFDALSSQKPFGQALPFSKALQHLEKLAGTQLDPHLVEAFSLVTEEGLAERLLQPQLRL